MSRHAQVLTVNEGTKASFVLTPEDLAEALGDLRYDALSEYLVALAEKLQSDSDKDDARGRFVLANALHAASRAIYDAAYEIGLAWKICEPHMLVSIAQGENEPTPDTIDHIDISDKE
jgi:hypothetical protein